MRRFHGFMGALAASFITGVILIFIVVHLHSMTEVPLVLFMPIFAGPFAMVYAGVYAYRFIALPRKQKEDTTNHEETT